MRSKFSQSLIYVYVNLKANALFLLIKIFHGVHPQLQFQGCFSSSDRKNRFL